MAAWWHYFTICLLCLVYLTSSQSEDLELEGIANEPSSRMKMTKVLIAKTKMKFLWNVPSPKPAYFIVRYNNKSVQVNDGAVQLKGLSPYTNYSVEVFACPKDAKNGCVSIIGPNMYRTKTGVPGRVKNIHLSQVNYTHVALTWDPPSEVVDSHQFYQVRAIDANTRIEVNTTRRGIHLPMPACRNGTLSTFQKVFINMVNFNNSTGAGALQYKGNSLTSIILYLDCLRALSKNTPEEVFKLSKVIVSKTWIKLWWSAPKMLKNPSHYLVMYNENIIQVKNTEVELTNLKSDTNYNIMVSACTMTGNCSLSTMPIELRTKLGIPDRVENLTVHKVNLTDGYLVSWNPPSVTNGQNLLYRVHILFVNGQQRTFDIENTSTLISVPKCNDKAPSSVEYVIKVAVVNLNDGVDELVGESENMTIFANCAVYTIQPPKLPQIEEFHIDSTSLSILCNLPSPPLKSASYYKVVINNATTPIRVEGPQVALHSLAPNTTHTVELYQCFVNCSSFFGSKTLQTKPLTPITIENLEVVDLNASHICINWMFSPTLKGLGNILYQVQLGHGQFVEEFLTNDSFVVFQKLICPSNRSDVISHHLFWVVINVTNIVDPSFVCEPKSVTLSVPCFNIYKSMFTNILLSNTSIFLQWTHVHPIGKNTNNNISYVVTYNGESKNVRNNYHMLTNLQPHTEYKIVISMCDSVCHNLTQPLVIRTNDAVGVKVENLTMKLLDASHALVSWVRSSVVDVVCNYSLKIKSSNFLFTNNLTSSTFTKVPVPTCEDTHSESYLVEVNIITTESISPSIVFQPATLTVLLQCESKKLTPTDLPVHLTRIVATTTTIDLTWNGTHPADYLVSFNDSSVHVSSTSAVLTDLTPGMEYTVKIVKCNDTTATSCNTSLVAPFSVHTNHEILRVEKVTIGSTDDSSLTISWVPAPSRSLPLRYDVSVISAINQFNASTEATFLQIPHPSCEFIETVDVHATITPYNEGEVAGAPTTAGIQLRCPHKAHLIQIDAYSHQITLSWKDPSTETGSHYVVRCVKNDTQLDATLTTTMTMATIDNLSANMTYQLQVRKCGRHNCSVLIDSFVVRTQVDAPSPSTAHLVENLTIEDINATHVCIRWSPPRAEASVADLSHASDQPMYDVRMHTNKGRTLYTSSTNYTHLYLPIPLCEDDVSSSSLEVYKIGIQVNGTCQQRGMDGHDAASSTIVLLSKCLSNFSDEQQCTTMSHWPINDVFLIAVLGSLIALLIYAAYTYKNFNYKYKVSTCNSGIALRNTS